MFYDARQLSENGFALYQMELAVEADLGELQNYSREFSVNIAARIRWSCTGVVFLGAPDLGRSRKFPSSSHLLHRL